MGYSYTRARRVFERQLKRFGKQAASECKIVRDGVYRPCVGARLEYKPRERGLYTDAEARILISAKSIDDNGVLPPEFEKDQILYAGTLYNIIQPILGPRQADPTIIYYDCQVVAVQNVTLITIDPLTMTIGMDMSSTGLERVREFSSALDLGFDITAEEIERSRFVAALLELGFDVELPELELTTYLSASMELGFEMTPPPLAEVIEEVSATVPLGFDMALSHITREFYLSSSMNLGFEVGADATSEVSEILLSAQMELGFEVDGVVTNFVEETSFMALSHSSSPFFKSYDGDYAAQSNPATLPPSTANEMRWSPNGRYLAIGHFSSPYLTVYDYASGAPVKLANPSTLPTNTIRKLDWHPSGEFIICGGDDTTLVEVYFVNGTTITRGTSRPTNPGSSVSALRFCPVLASATLGYLFAGFGTSTPIRYLCNYTPGSFAITSWGASEAQTTVAGTIQSIDMAPDGSKMVVAHTTTPFISPYTLSGGGGTCTKDSAVASPPNSTSNAFRGRYSPNGAMYACLHTGGDEITIYNTPAFTKRTAGPTETKPLNGTDLCWSDDSTQIFQVQSSSPFLNRYRASDMQLLPEVASPPTTASWAIDAYDMPGAENMASWGTPTFADVNSTAGASSLNLGPGPIAANTIVIIVAMMTANNVAAPQISSVVKTGASPVAIEQLFPAAWTQVSNRRSGISVFACHSGAGIASGAWTVNFNISTSAVVEMWTITGATRTVIAKDTVDAAGIFHGDANTQFINSAGASTPSYTRGGLSSKNPLLLSFAVYPSATSGIGDLGVPGTNWTAGGDNTNTNVQGASQVWRPRNSGNRTVAFTGATREAYSICIALNGNPPP